MNADRHLLQDSLLSTTPNRRAKTSTVAADQQGAIVIGDALPLSTKLPDVAISRNVGGIKLGGNQTQALIFGLRS